MTTNSEFTLDALSTESVVDNFNVNKQTFIKALQAFIASAQILDQFKRSVFYKTDIDRTKFTHYAAELRAVAIELDMTTDYALAGPRDDLALLTDFNTRVAHGIVGTATESGELAEVLLAIILGEPLDDVNLKEEIGDVQWYQHVLANAAGTDIDECLAAVVKKLKDKGKGRYAAGYTHEAAINRDTDAERTILESSLS